MSYRFREGAKQTRIGGGATTAKRCDNRLQTYYIAVFKKGEVNFILFADD